MFKRQTIRDLAEASDRDPSTIRAWLDRYELPQKWHTPRPCVLVLDASYFKRSDGILIARDPVSKENLYASEIVSETKEVYGLARHALESLGYVIQAVVLDGRRGIPKVFEGIPVQICQFHQLQIVRRKLTLRPETKAGQELLAIAMGLSKLSEEELKKLLALWYVRHKNFVNEKTRVVGCSRWFYTHRRVRSTYRSLISNLPHLYTFHRYPALKIPNTTNSLDGFFSRLKNLLSAHRGQTRERRWKMIRTILGI